MSELLPGFATLNIFLRFSFIIHKMRMWIINVSTYKNRMKCDRGPLAGSVGRACMQLLILGLCVQVLRGVEITYR